MAFMYKQISAVAIDFSRSLVTTGSVLEDGGECPCFLVDVDRGDAEEKEQTVGRGRRHALPRATRFRVHACSQTLDAAIMFVQRRPSGWMNQWM